MFKAIIQKIASWFKGEKSTIEQKADSVASEIKVDATTDVAATLDALSKLIGNAPISNDLKGLIMSTPVAATQPAANAGSNVNTAVQIALALKTIDASLSVEAIQAATNAALAAAYPVAA
ncbi:hypothetical protein [Paraburkholderia sp. BCC1885]|uniref:hypothetical protein n=1 Tax=Paraburkholderia sp. BCC1885 TaxID=2562669 RepID=UPI001182BE87|nr:hypothetical protein [Paraburkholderia sp. BCC1885]